MDDLVHELIEHSAQQWPDKEALCFGAERLTYTELYLQINRVAAALLTCGLKRGERVAVFLEKRIECVAALFGTSAAGAVFVPVNPLLKPAQITHILRDCNVRILVTSTDRLARLADMLCECIDLKTVVCVTTERDITPASVTGKRIVEWQRFIDDAECRNPHCCIDADMAAILYTSGSTGQPKGVVLSHRNIIAGAKSVAEYLGNTPDDRILALLPLSFDYGLSQLTTAFYCGAAVVLMNYLLPREVVNVVETEGITGLAAVPPLWMQLARQQWPKKTKLRYLTNSGGTMPQSTLAALRHALPDPKVFLMYGLTEAFRSTYLPPEELDRRPGSIGKAIPNAELMVVRTDGTPCEAGEPGELVHRGVLVAQGYWNDAEKTAERFRRAPCQSDGLVLPEIAVWSGDVVYRDEDGFLYFLGRRDEMIKTSGYRVSPSEIEEVLYDTGLVAEAVVCGAPHPSLGQAIVAAVYLKDRQAASDYELVQACRERLPSYMIPAHFAVHDQALPRNPNGKIDRKRLQTGFNDIFL